VAIRPIFDALHATMHVPGLLAKVSKRFIAYWKTAISNALGVRTLKRYQPTSSSSATTLSRYRSRPIKSAGRRFGRPCGRSTVLRSRFKTGNSGNNSWSSISSSNNNKSNNSSHVTTSSIRIPGSAKASKPRHQYEKLSWTSDLVRLARKQLGQAHMKHGFGCCW